jgi:predicted secreted protein
VTLFTKRLERVDVARVPALTALRMHPVGGMRRRRVGVVFLSLAGVLRMARKPIMKILYPSCLPGGIRAALLAAGVALAPSTATVAHAQGSPAAMSPAEPRGIVSLSSTAVVELPRDLMTLALSTTRESVDASTVQSQLKQALDAALTEARKVAKPGQVDVQTGAFSLYPRYGPRGTITGWQGTAELLIEGRDMTAISQLAGRIQTLTVARVGYGLSREAREKVESEATAQAVERFRGRAAELSRLFGYTGWAVRELSVSSADASPPPMPMLRAKVAMSTAAEEALPVEAGKGSVTISVSGTVQLTK